GDMARIERDLRRLAWVEPHVQHEPLLSYYESALANSSVAVAFWASGVFELDRGFSVAQRCYNVLIGKRNRRKAMNLPARPDSEAWSRLYTVLAELKWKGGNEQRNLVTSPDNLVCDYLKVE